MPVHRITRLELSRRLGVDRSTIWEWEQRRDFPVECAPAHKRLAYTLTQARQIGWWVERLRKRHGRVLKPRKRGWHSRGRLHRGGRKKSEFCARGHPIRGEEADVYISPQGQPICNICKRLHQEAPGRLKELHGWITARGYKVAFALDEAIDHETHTITVPEGIAPPELVVLLTEYLEDIEQ